MGTCASNVSNAVTLETPIEFTPTEIEMTYAFIFDTVKEMALDLLERELCTSQDLLPPSANIMLGLCGVAVLEIAFQQITKPVGVVVIPKGGAKLTKNNCPVYFRDVLVALIAVKDGLAQGGGVVSEVTKMKHITLHSFSGEPIAVWGSALQEYEGVLHSVREACTALKQLPQYDVLSQDSARSIEQRVKARRASQPPVLRAFSQPRADKAQGDFEDDDL